MKNAVMIACLAALTAATAGAQEKMMPSMSHAGGAQMAMTASYDGCVARGDDGKFTLTHVASHEAMHGGHEMMHDKGAMAGESMAPASITLTGTRVKLAKYVGQKVSVTGTSGADSLSVASVKTIAKSCR